MRSSPPHPPSPGRRAGLLCLAVALAVAPAALPAQAIGLGFGFGLGTRTGFSVSFGAQVTDEVQLVCKGGGLPVLPSSVSCGTHLYVLDNRDRFVVAEVGVLYPPAHRFPAEREETRWIFVQGGLGVRDHELPDDDDDGLPEYPRWVNAAYSGGLTLVVARIREHVTPTEEGLEYGERRISPTLWPLFFADAQVEIYLPGRNCARCSGPPSVP
jgi:hypothetical protein